MALGILACPIIFTARVNGPAMNTLKNIYLYGLPTLAVVWHLFGSIATYSADPNPEKCNPHLYNLNYTVVTVVNVILGLLCFLYLVSYLWMVYNKVFMQKATGYEASSRRSSGGNNEQRPEPWKPDAKLVVVEAKKKAVKRASIIRHKMERSTAVSEQGDKDNGKAFKPS